MLVRINCVVSIDSELVRKGSGNLRSSASVVTSELRKATRKHYSVVKSKKKHTVGWVGGMEGFVMYRAEDETTTCKIACE